MLSQPVQASANSEIGGTTFDFPAVEVRTQELNSYIQLYNLFSSMTDRSLIANFQVEAILEYEEVIRGAESQCLQGQVGALAPGQDGFCRGACTSNGLRCTGECPNDRGCVYRVICPGRDGVAVCPDMRVNRAGTYYIKFRYPVCNITTNLETDCPPYVTTLSRGFTVTTHADGEAALTAQCEFCEEVSSVTRDASFRVSAESVDKFGNLMQSGTVRATIDPQACNRTNMPDDFDCIEFVQSYNGQAFEYMPDAAAVTALTGSIESTVERGYVNFTDISINMAFRRLHLLFVSDAGNVALSRTIQVDSQPVSSLRVLKQPFVGEAGKILHFRIGLLDPSDFVVEWDVSTMVHMTWASSTMAKVPFTCFTSNCTSSVSQDGFVDFRIVVTVAGYGYRMTFRSGSSTVDSDVFTVLHTRPGAVYVVDHPLDTVSEKTFEVAPSAFLVDSFGNPVLFPPELSSDSRSADVRNFVAGCDSVLADLWCDADVCASRPTLLGCCTVNMTVPGNNEHQCKPGETAHTFQMILGLWKDVEQRPYDTYYMERPVMTNPSMSGISTLQGRVPSIVGVTEKTVTGLCQFDGVHVDYANPDEFSYLVKILVPQLGIENNSRPFKVLHGDLAFIHLLEPVPTGIVGAEIPQVAVLTDNWGNPILSEEWDLEVKLVPEYTPVNMTQALQGTTALTTARGIGNFTDLRILLTGVYCEPTCVAPPLRLLYTTSCSSGSTCSLQSQPPNSTSNVFWKNHEAVTGLEFQPYPATNWVLDSSSPPVNVVASDRYGNLAVNISTTVCAHSVVNGVVQPGAINVSLTGAASRFVLVVAEIAGVIDGYTVLFIFDPAFAGSCTQRCALNPRSARCITRLLPLQVEAVDFLGVGSGIGLPPGINGTAGVPLPLTTSVSLCRENATCEGGCCLVRASATIGVAINYLSQITPRDQLDTSLNGVTSDAAVMGIAPFNGLVTLVAG
eukprot:1990549-Rhodomonas_salina.1